MKKLKGKILLTNILVGLMVLFSSSFVKAADNDLILNGTWESPYTLAVNYARGNLDAWFNLNPNDLLNKSLNWRSSSDEALNAESAGTDASACIQLNHKGQGGAVFIIKNVVDILNDNGTPKVIVYSPSGKQTFSIFDEKAAVWLKLGHITTQAYINKEVATAGAKAATQIFMWENMQKLIESGMDSAVYEPTNVVDANSVINEATNYYNTIKNISYVDNTTSKKLDVGVTSTSKYTYVGPFNITYNSCTFKSATVGTISAIGFATSEDLKNETYNKDLSKLPSSSQNFYLVLNGRDVDVSNKEIILTTNSVKFDVTRIMLIDGQGGSQNFVIYGGKSEQQSFELKLPKVTFGSLTVTKKDASTKEALSGIGFKIYNETKKQWLKVAAPGNTAGNYGTEDEAMTFYTGANGTFAVTKLPYGKYQVKEVSLGQYKDIYAIPTSSIDVSITGNKNQTIYNTQKYVALSGYVWIENYTGKKSELNSIFDSDEKGVNGVIVYLKDSNNNVVKTVKTSELGLYGVQGGEYKFEKVDVDKITDYHVEFEYDGVLYQSTTVSIQGTGSKATDVNTRKIIDANFATVNATGEQKVSVKESNNKEKYAVNYHDLNTSNYTSSLITNTTIADKYITVDNSKAYAKVQANTSDAGYYLKDNFSKGTTRIIKNVNLGIYEKAQADIALNQDLATVNVGVNGYWHIYSYSSRQSEWDGENWNVGVKFANKYVDNTYNRAIYKADAEYTDPEDSSKELQVILTYKVELDNESSYVTKINSINYYFANAYGTVTAGTGLDANNSITGKLSCSNVTSYNDNYSQTTIDTRNVGNINAAESKAIYVQFRLDRKTVLNLINGKTALDTAAEITSYTSYKTNGKDTLAVVDKDSVPGNYNITAKTNEDDNDKAPSILLVFTNSREIAGTVFEDATTVANDTTRNGNGTYDNGETVISGVQVALYKADGTIAQVYDENSNAWVPGTITTGSDGSYKFSGYIPGEYEVRYTWGDKTYTVQNYKGTVYDSSRNQSNKEWYKENIDIRRTDAVDDYSIRTAIDEQTKNITNSLLTDVKDAYENGLKNIITTMTAKTPTMSFGVEYETTITNGIGDQVKFIVNNIDYGIALRAKQQLDLAKHVSSFKIVSATGTILVDAQLENGTLTGAILDHVTTIPQQTDYAGYIKAEMSEEILQGSTLQVTYAITATNSGERDYASEQYYKYGVKSGTEVTLTPSAVVDYLDNDFGFDSSANEGWIKLTTEELQGKTNIAYIMIPQEDLNNKVILYNETISKNLKVGESTSVNLNVSKLLTTSEDLTFDNKAEVVTVTKEAGSLIEKFPTAEAEKTIVTPSTGENKNILPITIGAIALIVLATGIIIIKKKVIDKN